MAITPLNPDRNITSVVVVDGSLTDLQAILSGLDPSATVIVLDPAQDGIQQIADALSGLSGLDAIHVISHGASGQLNLGSTQLSQDTLAQYQNQLATIGNALSATGDLLLYGCDVAQGVQGQAFISALAYATGADVAASTDLTGNALLGGNWQLEAATGLIEANTLNTNIAGVLAVIDGTIGDDTLQGALFNDTINGGDGNDTINGGDGNDTLLGGLGDDILNGEAGNNTLDGGDGNDYLQSSYFTNFGSPGNDILLGGNGNDTLKVEVYTPSNAEDSHQIILIDGGAGDDLIQISSDRGSILTATGGLGIDTYQLGNAANFTVTDFTVGVGGDLIDVTTLLNNSAYYGFSGGNPFSVANGFMRLIQSGTNTLFQYDADGAAGPNNSFQTLIVLQGVTATAITSDNFVGGITPDGAVIPDLILNGTAGADILVGGLSNDTINGLAGDDTITDFWGDDIIDGGDGNDTINAGSGNGTIQGGLGDDILNGDAGNDTIDGGDGIDTINGGDGNDSIQGGLGDDTLNGEAGNNTLDGGDGNDYLQSTWSGGNDTLLGGLGNDTLQVIGAYYDPMWGGPSQTIVIDGGAGDDLIQVNIYNASTTLTATGGLGVDTYQFYSAYGSPSTASYTITDFTAGVGGDLIDVNTLLNYAYYFNGGNPFSAANGFMRLVQSGADTLFQYDEDGAAGTNYTFHTAIVLQGVTATAITSDNFVGGISPDGAAIPGLTLNGTAAIDILTGGLSNDTINGLADNDFIDAHGGDDIIDGGDGNDTIYAGSGDDTVQGGLGDDTLNGEAGNDTLDGGDGIDTINGGDGNDIIQGGLGDDALKGDAGNNTLDGGDGNDYLQSRWDGVYDILLGGLGNDTLVVEDNYNYFGPPRTVVIDGGAGDDLIDIGGSNDLTLTATGGMGIDTYQISSADTTTSFTVTDFTAGVGGDLIDVNAFIASNSSFNGGNPFSVANGYMRLVQSGANTLFQYDVDGAAGLNSSFQTLIVLQGVTATAITSANFVDGIPPDGSDAPGLILNGTIFSDTLEGGIFNDTINGLADDDHITDLGGNDTIDGGDGNDIIDGGAGDDIILGGLGNDSLTGGKGDDAIDGGDGIDFINGGLGNDNLQGGLGDDTLNGGDDSWDTGNDILDGGAGYDRADYTNAGNYNQGVTVNLALTSQQDTVGAGLDTLLNIESLSGSAYNDTLTSAALGSSLYGNAGDDILIGDAGNDILDGGSGFDRADYSSATAAVTVSLAVTVQQNTVGAGLDTLTNIESLYGSSFNDTLTSDAGGSGLYGNGGDDTLNGDLGNDILDGGAGNDILNGGAGFDRADYSSATAAVIVSLAVTSQQDTVGAGLDTLTNIESLYGSNFNDTLTGDAPGSSLYGNGGDDILNGDAGDDILNGGAGNDILDGGAGYDCADYTGSTSGVTVSLALSGQQNTIWAGLDTLVNIENLSGSSYSDTLTGDTLNNSLTGNDGNDSLYGGDGNDTLIGGYSDDLLNGGAGSDILDGGYGIDTADYQQATAGVTVSLALAGSQDTIGAGLDTLIGIDNLYGSSSFGDILTGDALANLLEGFGGNDTLNGGDADDELYGDAGDDYLDGGAGNDRLNDYAGNDTLDGGAGIDTADYQWATAGVTVSLVLSTQQDTIGAGLDTLINIENLSGSNFNDTLTGNALDNFLQGNGGNDSFTGAGGNDLFQIAASGVSTITDFSLGDSISIVGFYSLAGPITAGNGAAVLSGQIQVETVGGITSLYIGTDSIVGADFQIQLTGTFSAAAFASYWGNQIVLNNTPTGAVTITGTATQGQTLTAANTLADVDGLGAISYQWQANGANISGATNNVYNLTANEVGKTITVSASYIDGHGTAESVASSATSSVAALPSPPPPPPSTPPTPSPVASPNNLPTGTVALGGLVNGKAAQGLTLTASHSLADADGLGAISYQWKAGGVAIGGATGSNYLVSAADAGKALSVSANYTDGKGAAESVTSSPVKVNSAPKAVDDTATTSEKTRISIAVLGNDSDPDEAEGDSKALVSVTASSRGVQVTDSGGTLNYNPGLLFQSLGAGQTATDTFTYTIKDSFGLTGTASATVTVTGVNDAPLAHADGVLYVEGSSGLAINISDLLRNDVDPDAGDTLTFSSVSTTADSSGASLTLNNGIITYNPGHFFDSLKVGEQGSDAFSYEIKDANGGTATGSVQISVIGTDNGFVVTGGSGTDILFDPDGGALSGNKGDDIYIVSKKDQHVIENAGQGDKDKVITTLDEYSLDNNIELLSYKGEDDFTGTGNDLANVIEGNVGDDQLSGGGGNDTLLGGLGNDLLKGGTGSNTLNGGAGDDTYELDEKGQADKIIEKPDQGTDEIDTGKSTLSLNPFTEVENLTYTGAGNFTGSGNGKDNTLTGGAGDDKLSGGAGNDSLNGGDGNNDLNGGIGTDTLILEGTLADYTITVLKGPSSTKTAFTLSGLQPDDIIQIVNTTSGRGANKIVGIETVHFQGDDSDIAVYGVTPQALLYNVPTYVNDILDGTENADNFDGGTGDDTLNGNGGNDSLSGGQHNDTLNGGSGEDSLNGDAGKDTLDGGEGADKLYGGAGDDTYIADNLADQIIEKNAQSADTGGNDTVNTALAGYTLTDQVENLLYTGTGNFTGTGNALANKITGGIGNDTLNGGEGTDKLYGGAGDDVYLIDNAADQALEKDAQGADTGGIDTIRTSLGKYSLAANSNIENLERLDPSLTTAFIATGNSADNRITGGAGNDSLNGGGGIDTAVFNDTKSNYSIQLLKNNIVQLIHLIDGVPGAETDTLSNIEKVSFADGAYVVAKPADPADNNQWLLYNVPTYQDDIIDGTASANTVNAGAGNDKVSGQGGNDSLYGETGDDQLYGESGDDSLNGGVGNDLLDGGLGSDKLEGGAGNDSYVVDTAAQDDPDPAKAVTGDRIIELAGPSGGIDTVRTTLSRYTLGDNLENLIFLGINAVSAPTPLSEGLTMSLAGSVAANAAGVAGQPGDTLIVSHAGAVLASAILSDNGQFALNLIQPPAMNGATLDVQIIHDGHLYTLADNTGLGVSLSYAGVADPKTAATVNVAGVIGAIAEAFTGTGNSLNNSLSGGAGDDTLDGKAGADTLKGGLGNDTYFIDNSSDNVIEKADEGIDLIKTSLNTYSLALLARQHIENLDYLGNNGVIGNFIGTGNAQNNRMTGNTGKDTLNGGAGNDTLNGGANDDKLLGGDDNDTLNGGEGNDTLEGGNGDDSLIASLGNDTLIGGEGADTLNLTGINLLFADKGKDKNTGFSVSRDDKTITLTGKDGQKLTLSSIESYIFSDATVTHEQLIANTSSNQADTYTGDDSAELFDGKDGDDSISGGGGDDSLDGGKGKDRLDGGTGNDRLTGGLGDDSYSVDAENDTVIEQAGPGSGIDIVSLAANYAATAYTLAANVENLDAALVNTGITLSGNELANSLTGGNGNDTLDGKAGIDKLLGGLGDDTLIYDSADSKIDGGPGIDTLKLNDSGITLDLNKLTFGKISSIEKLDLTGAGNNSLLVNKANLANLTGADGHELYVIGDAGDSVTLSKTLWEQADDIKVNDVNYHQYIQITGSQTDHMYVLEAVTQSLV